MSKPKTSETPKPQPPATAGAATTPLATALDNADAAALVADAKPDVPPAEETPAAEEPKKLTEKMLRDLAQSRATVGGKTDAALADAIYTMLKDAPPEQVAQSIADNAKTGASVKKVVGKQADIKKQEKAAAVQACTDRLTDYLKTERAADRFTVGTHRLDIDFDAATATPVKGKSREKNGGVRNAVTKETLAEHKVQAFVLADGSEPTAVVRGQTVKPHPYAYMNGAHPSRPYFGCNYYRDGMTEEDASAARKKAGMSAELTDGQKRDLKNKVLKLGDDPARLLYKLGKDDSTTRVVYADRPPSTVKELIASLDAPTPTPTPA